MISFFYTHYYYTHTDQRERTSQLYSFTDCLVVGRRQRRRRRQQRTYISDSTASSSKPDEASRRYSCFASAFSIPQHTKSNAHSFFILVCFQYAQYTHVDIHRGVYLHKEIRFPLLYKYYTTPHYTPPAVVVILHKILTHSRVYAYRRTEAKVWI